MSVSAEHEGYITVDGSRLPVHILQKSGNDNENFVILFLGDGYTKDLQDKFIEDIKFCADRLLISEPFQSYSDKINIYAVPAVSAQSGASYDGYTDKDTYFQVTQYNKAGFIRQMGKDGARAIKTAL